MRRKPVQAKASDIPDGTAFFVAVTDTGPSFTVNSARISKGNVRILKSHGRRPGSATYPRTSHNGNRSSLLIVQRVGAKFREDLSLVSVRSGKKFPVNRTLFRRFGSVAFGGFSPQERYLIYSWLVDEASTLFGTDKTQYTGTGIYDSEAQEVWWDDKAVHAAWSASGDRLVYGRYFVNGKYPRGYSDRRFFFPKGFFDRSPPSIIKDLHFFTKDVRTLKNSGAERVSQAEAERLVGGWYRRALEHAVPRLRYPFGEWYVIADENRVAPGNKGIILVDARDTDPPEVMLEALSGPLEWSTEYVDAGGRSTVYKPSPQLNVYSWSRDGERAYGLTAPSATHSLPVGLICFWVRTGRYAVVPLRGTIGQFVAFIED